MCRITGYIEKTKSIDNKDIISKMVSMVKHGGPDDDGIELFSLLSNEGKDFAMGFTRLSILDVSNNGHQPMYDEEKDVCLTLNGEIYNAFDYKDELIKKGYKFRGNSDTEIVLYLYKEFGLDGMLEHVNGTFAICIMDNTKHRLFLVRDRLGVKPLYYYDTKEVFLYSSEFKTFYAHPLFKNELNTKLLTEQFMFRYIAGENTLLKNVKNVLPGHYLDISNEGIKDVTYWKIENKRNSRINDVRLEKMIEDSVNDRLLSDVKLGMQLSGGVDSTLVMKYMNDELRGNSIDTFSVVFEDDTFSEKRFIEEAVTGYNVKQHQIMMKPQDFFTNFGLMTWHMDTPINHPNSIGIYLVCKEARDKGVKVLMTGEGADEVFGGYPRYLTFLVRSKYKLLNKIYSREKGDEYITDCDTLFMNSSLYVHPKEIKKLLKEPNFEAAFEERKRLMKKSAGDDETIEKYLNYELWTYLVDILNRQDKMSMAASVETRVPFLNYRLIEQVRSQRSNTYIRRSLIDLVLFGGMHNTKIILKSLSKRYFGNKFAYRKKSGFPLPLREIFLSEDFSVHIEETIIPFLKDLRVINEIELDRLWSTRRVIQQWELEALWVTLAFGEWAYIFLREKEIVTEYNSLCG